MKNKIFCLIFGMMALLLTGCQSDNEPMRLANALVEMVFYGVDSQELSNAIDLTAEELQDIFVSWTEMTLTSELLPALPPDEDELAELDEYENYEDVDDFDEFWEDEMVIHPLIQEMAGMFLDSVRSVTTFNTRLLTLSPSHAVIAVSVAGMDISNFYSEYLSLLITAASRPSDISDDDFLEEIFDQYVAILSNMQATANPTDIFIELVRYDGEWFFFHPDMAITQLYSALTGSPLF